MLCVAALPVPRASKGKTPPGLPDARHFTAMSFMRRRFMRRSTSSTAPSWEPPAARVATAARDDDNHSTETGESNAIDEALKRAVRQRRRSVRLSQICFVDHTDLAPPPHLHLQILFSDRSRTPWMTVPNVSVADLHAAVGRWPGRAPHLHEHETGADERPNGGPALEAVTNALPTLSLTELSSSCLIDEGFDCCPVCLDEYAAGQEVTFIGCAGAHVAHTSCLGRWLVVASTCPTCRFALPRDSEGLDEFLRPATEQRDRVARGLLPPCQPVDDEDEKGSRERPMTPIKLATAADANEPRGGGDHNDLNDANNYDSPSTAPASPTGARGGASLSNRRSSGLSPFADIARCLFQPFQANARTGPSRERRSSE